MSPQVPAFNQGIWNHLEMKVRNLVLEKGTIYIVTGPVFKANLGKIGTHKVTVPGFYYKVLLTNYNNKYQTIAFLLPNKLGTSHLSEYVTTIDAIEKITNINFWSILPDSIENKIESEVIITDWFSKNELKKSLINKKSLPPIKDFPFNAIDSKTAINYIDSTKTVCGCVVSANYVEWASKTYLNLDFKYPNHIFTLVIKGDYRNNFEKKPEDYYYEKNICVTGKIASIKGIPTINMKKKRGYNNFKIISLFYHGFIKSSLEYFFLFL